VRFLISLLAESRPFVGGYLAAARRQDHDAKLAANHCFDGRLSSVKMVVIYMLASLPFPEESGGKEVSVELIKDQVAGFSPQRTCSPPEPSCD
jgi:hypothetical protein